MSKGMINLLTRLFAKAPGERVILDFDKPVECVVVAVEGDKAILEFNLEDVCAIGIPKE
jgi:hypothetical protein